MNLVHSPPQVRTGHLDGPFKSPIMTWRSELWTGCHARRCGDTKFANQDRALRRTKYLPGRGKTRLSYLKYRNIIPNTKGMRPLEAGGSHAMRRIKISAPVWAALITAFGSIATALIQKLF